ncbi:MAG: tetratricopeptide repeat protein [Elusimicrobia bacterium]|nr:tetratricopeptide repeat protein [Elusimicrobiota bacterium]
MRSKFFLLLALIFCGCGGPFYVRLPGLVPANPTALERYRILRSTYLLIKAPSVPREDFVGGMIQKALKQQPLEVRVQNLGTEIGKMWRGMGAEVLAYRVVRENEGPDPFLGELNPTGILTVELEYPRVRFVPRDKAITFTDSQGKKQSGTAKVWDCGVRLGVQTRLSSSEGKEIFNFRFDVNVGEEKPRREGQGESWQEDWYSKVEPRLFSQVAQRLNQGLGWGVIERRRPILHDKENEDSKSAYRAVQKGQWEAAEGIWKTRLQSAKGDWRDQFNLAVAAERKKDYAVAREFYGKAQEAGKNANEFKTVSWTKIYEDLSQAVTVLREGPEKPSQWFERKMAVLPFSDETTSIEGPDFIRRLAHGTFKSGGYAVLPLEEVDSVLRAHGFSQGGQLRAAKPVDIAQWLDSQVLLFGHIEEFKEIPLGVYHKREVSGRFSLWDAKSQAEIWSSQESVLRESGSDKRVGERIVGQLAKGWWERMLKTPLGAEATLFVRRNLEKLPMKGGIK